MKTFFKYVFYLLIFIIILLIGALVAIQTPYVQSKITYKVIQSLNQKFGTSLQVGSVDVDFFGDVKLYDVSAKDHHEIQFINVSEITADVNLWDIYQNYNDININELKLDEAAVEVITYKGETQSNFIQFINKFVQKNKKDSPSEFKLKGNLLINNSELSIINRNLDIKRQVWLDAKNLNVIVKKIDLEGSVYTAKIVDLNFDAYKNGEDYTLKNLSSQFKMTDQGISFNDLKLKTQSSLLSGKIVLSYDDIDDFSEFGDKVNWDILLNEGNYLAYKDLRYFVPDWEKDIVVDIQGKAQGTLNHLNLENFEISNGNTRILTKQINLGDMMDGKFVINTNHIEANTSYEELIRILPENLNKNITDFIQRFGNFSYKGALKLDDRNIFVDGLVYSALGDADMVLNLHDYSGKNPSYNGKIYTKSFDLQKLTDTKELGKVSGNMTFRGNGFNAKTIKIDTKGNLNFLDINGDRYQNIAVDGILNHQIFDGKLAINDPNAKLNYKGIFDFSEKHLKMNFTSQVDFVNLNHFGIIKKKNSWLKANIKAETQFSNLNDLEGHLELTDIVFNTDTVNLQLPLATLDIAAAERTQKNLILDIPNYLLAELNGTFQIEELGDVLQNGFGNFLVDYRKKPVTPNQAFDFNIQIEDNLVSYFVPGLYLQPTTTVYGRTNDREELFEFNLNSPYIQYQDYKADSVALFASTINNKSFNLASKKIKIQDFLINDFNANGNKINDSIVAQANFYAGENNFGKFDLNFYQTFNKEINAVKTGFSPSTILIEGQTWQINPNNDMESNYAIINFEKGQVMAKDIFFQSGNQYLRLNGNYINQNNFTVDADLENLNLAKIIPPTLIPNLKLEGIANGSIDMVKNKNELKPVADLKIDSIALNDYYIGNYTTTATYDVNQKLFELEGSLDRNNVNTLFLTGTIDNKGKTPELDMVANLDDFNINILGVFLEDVMSEWSGKLSGDVNIKGNPTDPDIQGFVTGENIGFKVVYLGTKYRMDGENDFILSKSPGSSGFLTLPDVEFTEVTSKTKGFVDGNLIFSSLTDWFLDLEFNTDKLLVMNNTVADNELFYGKVFGRGTFEMFGPASDMEIFAHDVDVLKGSTISLNTGGTSSVEDKKFIQFYAYDETGKIIEESEEKNKISGVTIDLSLNVDEGTEVNLVLDAQTDDKISARGIANDFKIQMNKAGNLNIDGEFTLSGGTYNYREYLVIDKDFEIEEGGYIRFNGDPYNAGLNVKAVYSRYVNNVGDYLGLANNQPTMVDLVIAITGDLENTNIDFDIETPDAGSQISNSLDTKLASTTDELIKQASFLLVLGRFGTDELLSAGTATGAATASAFELLGKQVGNIFSSIIPGLEINPTYLQAVDKNQQSDKIQTQLNWAINERLKINGAVGTPVGSEFNEAVTTQVEIDYDISKEADGELVLRGFSRPTSLGIENYNYNSTYAQSYGAGVIYSKSFNSFKELFKSKEKVDSIRKQQKIEEKLNAPDSTKNKFSFIQFKN